MSAYRLAKREDLPKLTALWHTCFGDTPQEIGEFWSALFDRIRVFMAASGEAMLCALPVQLVDDGGEICPAAYLYAVCTAPEARGQGLCAGLMAYGEDFLKNEGVSLCCLVPSSRELFSFYEKLGYQTVFYHDRYTISAQTARGNITKITPEAYQNLRQLQLYGNFIDYDLWLLSWQQHLCKSSGAGLYRIETADTVCCAAAEKHGESLCIKELLPDCPEAASALAACLGCSQVCVRTQNGRLPFGMAKALKNVNFPEIAYLGMAFD